MMDIRYNTFSEQFEARVSAHLPDLQGRRIGAAVSGGADSLSLLLSLCHVAGPSSVCVITVNHNIRPAAESAADARHVEVVCQSLGISCTTVTLKPGVVDQAAAVRQKGIEEAARFLRYQAFEEFVKKNNLSYLCLAHTQNDQLETIVMRFLQGSSKSGCISSTNGIFLRPLLSVTRSEIEQYLAEQHQPWCTDKTNFDNQYLRNRIRNQLIPQLTTLFPGWESAVLRGAGKRYDDETALDTYAGAFHWQRETAADGVFMDAAAFSGCSAALRRRLLYTAFSLLQIPERVPYQVVQTVLTWQSPSETGVSISACGITIGLENAIIFVRTIVFSATESGFFAILDEPDVSVQCAGTAVTAVVTDKNILTLKNQKTGVTASCRVSLPVCIRSIQSGDTVRSNNGVSRSVSGVLSSWHVTSEIRHAIPLIQDLSLKDQPVTGIAGSLFGYPDWICQEYSSTKGI
jgi:tRNA(Ile)-lysidine synthase